MSDKKINIDDKELDRDIINLNLPPIDIVPPDTVDDLDIKDQRKNRSNQSL